MARFAQQTDLFVNEDVLRDGYIPDELVARDEELEDYKNALQTAVNGHKPNNIFVYGETGLGKTLASRIMFRDLKEDQKDFEGVSFEFVWINCKDKTSYNVAVSIVNELRPSGAQIPTTGHSSSKVHDILWDELEGLDATHAYIVLDEVDSLGTDDQLLYQLSRANSENFVADDEVKVGVVGISNDFKYREGLSSRVGDKLCEDEILFDHYDADQLRDILDQRAEKAFREGALNEEVIPYIAADIAQDSGSARHALNVLRKSGTLARRDDADSVSEAHARGAYSKVESGLIEDELRSLPAQSHVILYALTVLAERGETPTRRKTIYNVYREIAEDHDLRVKSQRTIHNRLSELALGSILSKDERNEGLDDGRYFVYDFDVSKELVLKTLRENDRVAYGQ